MTEVDTEAGPAVFSPGPEFKYRYTLTRRWDESKGVVNWLMLNPSTADHRKLDPTLRRCRDFTASWGYGGFTVTNLFAIRTKDPLVMKASFDPIGEDNDFHIVEQAQQANLVICGWGTHGGWLGRDTQVRALLDKYAIKLHYLRITRNGFPNHPLFLPSVLRPLEWTS